MPSCGVCLFVSPSVCHTILGFPTKRHGNILTGGHLPRTVIGTRDITIFFRNHMEQSTVSTSSFKTVILLGSDTSAETENFLYQRDDNNNNNRSTNANVYGAIIIL